VEFVTNNRTYEISKTLITTLLFSVIKNQSEWKTKHTSKNQKKEKVMKSEVYSWLHLTTNRNTGEKTGFWTKNCCNLYCTIIRDGTKTTIATPLGDNHQLIQSEDPSAATEDKRGLMIKNF
jgi:hypothetical protein